MSKKRKVSNDTFYVTRRVGRVLGDHRVFRDQGRVGVGVSGGVVSSTLLFVLHLRHRWVPVRTELVPLHVGAGPIPEAVQAVAARLELEVRVVPPVDGAGIPEQLLDVAQALELDAVAVGDVIEDRAAAVLGGLVFDGALSPLPDVLDATGRPTLVRPYAMLPEAAVLRAAADNGIGGHPPTHRRDREWMERLLAGAPGDRHDLLTNLVKAPGRVRKDYLV